LTPVDFVPKQSQIACVLQCGGIWIGGKGWGVTWKLIQAVVKPKEVMSVFGKCHIKLSDEELSAIEKSGDDDVADEHSASANASASATVSTHVDDSDSEEEEPPKPVIVEKPAAKPVVTPATVEKPVVEEKPAAAAPVKKVVKKVAPK
jgi:hypothetical protein